MKTNPEFLQEQTEITERKTKPWRRSKSKMGREFHALAIKEALGTIKPTEMERLEALDKARY
jgi:hypothetical protein